VIPMSAALDHVDQEPLRELTVRIAPLQSDGTRELRVPSAEGEFLLTYRVLDGRHSITTTSDRRITVDVVGPSAPPVRIS
jgi:hypothetical protein